MEKVVFVLTETDSTDITWCHNEVFSNIDNARVRLKELYDENVVERDDLILKSDFNKDSANAEFYDGGKLAWNIKECIVDYFTSENI